MPFKEKCPVCRIGWRVRPDVKTCSRQCSKEWANWSPEQRSKASLTMAADAPTVIDESLQEALKEAYKELAIGAIGKDDPYPDPLTEDDPEGVGGSDEAAHHIMKILGGDK